MADDKQHLLETSQPPQIKDSGERRTFATGAVRDAASEKLRCEFLHPLFELAMARWMSLGAIKYDAWNFAKGMPASVFVSSAERHRLKFRLGFTDEDHLSAWAFNIMGLIMLREGINTGRYEAELWDLPDESWCGGPSDLEWLWQSYEADVKAVAKEHRAGKDVDAETIAAANSALGMRTLAV